MIGRMEGDGEDGGLVAAEEDVVEGDCVHELHVHVIGAHGHSAAVLIGVEAGDVRRESGDNPVAPAILHQIGLHAISVGRGDEDSARFGAGKRQSLIAYEVGFRIVVFDSRVYSLTQKRTSM